jgi:hypothetical protein
MMDMDEIIGIVGEAKFHQACADARRTAAGTGKSLGKNDFDSDVPHDVSSLIWDSDGETGDKLELTFRFYEQMPCYAYLFYISMYMRDFSEPTKHLFWSKYKTYLAAEETLADPVAYSLWCGYFEDGPARAAEAWNILTAEITNDLLLQRLLFASGPVPFELKEKLYRRLLPEPRWHYYSFQSLLHSQFDVYGSVDREKGKAVLGRLVLPHDTEHLAKLRAALR